MDWICSDNIVFSILGYVTGHMGVAFSFLNKGQKHKFQMEKLQILASHPELYKLGVIQSEINAPIKSFNENKTYSLSFLDELMPAIITILVLFALGYGMINSFHGMPFTWGPFEQKITWFILSYWFGSITT